MPSPCVATARLVICGYELCSGTHCQSIAGLLEWPCMFVHNVPRTLKTSTIRAHASHCQPSCHPTWPVGLHGTWGDVWLACTDTVSAELASMCSIAHLHVESHLRRIFIRSTHKCQCCVNAGHNAVALMPSTPAVLSRYMRVDRFRHLWGLGRKKSRGN